MKSCIDCLHGDICKHSPAFDKYIAAEAIHPFEPNDIALICKFFIDEKDKQEVAAIVRVENLPRSPQDEAELHEESIRPLHLDQ